MRAITPSTTNRIAALSVAAGVGLAVTCGTAIAADPKVPPAGPAEDRLPVAILTTGFDYTRPEIAARLARDGEGEIIAWDVPGNDRFPYDKAGDTELLTALVNLLPASAPVALLPVQVDLDDPGSLAKGLAFIARTPARTVIVPLWTSNRETWSVFADAAAHFTNLRIVVRGCPDLAASPESQVYPRDLQLPNLGTATTESDPSAPLQAYVAALPCLRP